MSARVYNDSTVDETIDADESIANISTVSEIGHKIKSIFLSNLPSERSHATSSRKDNPVDKPRNFTRLSYEFDVDPLSFAELPTFVTKSEQVTSQLSCYHSRHWNNRHLSTLGFIGERICGVSSTETTS
jgi:hypothetical protein